MSDESDGVVFEASRRVDDLLAGRLRDADGGVARAMLVMGPPRSGKTRFALDTLVRLLKSSEKRNRSDPARSVFRSAPPALLACSLRRVARDINAKLLPRIGSTVTPRLVTTLPALAFAVLSRARSARHAKPPRLLNGAEQDALVNEVLGVHRRHAKQGDQCDTCRLLAAYFTGKSDDGRGVDGIDYHPSNQTTSDMFKRCLTPAFVAQLREMFARVTEVADSKDDQNVILGRLRSAQTSSVTAGGESEGFDVRDRLHLQWRLALTLRGEYSELVARRFNGEFRRDSSTLFRAATRELLEHPRACASAVPATIIVDDAQDVTVAGMEFLRALEPVSHVILVANPDEAVQTFRGASPDALLRRVVETAPVVDSRSSAVPALGRLGAVPVELGPSSAAASPDDASYRDVLASRISLSITSDEEGLPALPQRPEKLPDLHGALSGAELPVGDPLLAQGRMDVSGLLYGSPAQERDDIVRRIVDAHLEGARWSDMAVIAHDNSTVRSFGEALRASGVPVRYSSVTRPFASDPLVQGLLSLLRLARMRNGVFDLDEDPDMDKASHVPLTVQENRMLMDELETYLSSPLCEVPVAESTNHYRSVRLSAVLSLLSSVVTMAAAGGDSPETDVASGKLAGLAGLWRGMAGGESNLPPSFVGTGRTHEGGADAASSGEAFPDVHVVVEEPSSSDSSSRGPERTVPALCSLLVRHLPSHAVAADGSCGTAASPRTDGDPLAPVADGALGAVLRIADGSPDAEGLRKALDVIADVADDLRGSGENDPAAALWSAWSRSKVADRWQSLAIGFGDESDLANDRLDVAVRLLDYAKQSDDSHKIGDDSHKIKEFIDQVSGMDVVADSLSRTHPLLDAVTLTTPAGSVGGSWRLVWMPRLQDGVWPNLAPRNTMFGADELAAVALRGGDPRHTGDAGLPALDESDREVLRGEQRSLLVAVTRASSHLVLSAVWSDDEAPSDFLRVYAPELFPRHQERGKARFVDVGPRDAMPSTPRGLVVAARQELTRRVAKWYDSTGVTGGDRRSKGRSATSPQETLIDPVHALVMLARKGCRQADPRNWFFLPPRTGEPTSSDVPDVPASSGATAVARAVLDPSAGSSSGSTEPGASRRREDPSPVVRLSPSMVDSIWACPVCALLERQMSGPAEPAPVMSFGTIIHRVAQIAGERGLDRPGAVLHGPDGTELDVDDVPGRISGLTSELRGIYDEVRGPLDAFDGVENVFQTKRSEKRAGTILRNMADYFVRSARREYASGKSGLRMGTLRDVVCEFGVTAEFGIADVLKVYNGAGSPREEISADDMAGILGVLAGGMPRDFRPDLRIRLTSRIDRLELRHDDRGDFCRIIDYKTGRRGHSGAQCFTDLQLVCYQLALRFAGRGDVAAEDRAGLFAEGSHPRVSSAALFDVSARDAPGYFHSAENAAQPPLFGDDGDITSDVYASRPYAANLWKLFTDAPDLDAPHDQVSDRAWERLVRERDEGTLTFWALSMIARVFYAAAIVTTDLVPPHPVRDDGHRRNCRFKGACPRCSDSGKIDTVMGVTGKEMA